MFSLAVNDGVLDHPTYLILAGLLFRDVYKLQLTSTELAKLSNTNSIQNSTGNMCKTVIEKIMKNMEMVCRRSG